MPEYKESDISSQVWQTRILQDKELMNSPDDAKLRKRAAKRSVPDAEKDSAYWERRHRNNAAAKRSREIKRQQEYIYKSFVANAIASFEQLSKWCRTLLEYCPPELQKQAENEISITITKFQQSLPQNISSDRQLERSLSPHGDEHNRSCDGDLDTDGGSHSSMISEAGDDSGGDLQITHMESSIDRSNFQPPVLSPVPTTHLNNQMMNQTSMFPPQLSDPSPTQGSYQSQVVNMNGSLPTVSQEVQLEAMQLMHQKQQQMSLGAINGIPVIISPENALLNPGYQQLLLKSLIKNSMENDQKPVIHPEPKISNMMVSDTKFLPEKVVPQNPVISASSTPKDSMDSKMTNVLAIDPATGNVISFDSKAAVIPSNEKKTMGGSKWSHMPSTQLDTPTRKRPLSKCYMDPTSTPNHSSTSHNPNSDTKDWNLSMPVESEDVPDDIKNLAPLVSRVFVSLDTKDIVELIRCIAQEFLGSMGETVPSTGLIWQIFIAIRDAIPTLGRFRPQDVTSVIRNKFNELRQRSLNDTEIIVDNQLPYQQLLTHFQTYLSEQLKEQQAVHQRNNQPPSPKRARHPEKKSQNPNAFQEIVNSLEPTATEGGVIDNALHRCSVELEKRSQMTFKRLEMLRSRPGITIEQLNDELKKITNNSDSFQKLLDKAMTNEMHLRTLHAKARNYQSNDPKKL